MSAMEYRGQILLEKWLSGDVTYMEELELFELAEKDEMLKVALEGYIGQDIIQTNTITSDSSLVAAQLSRDQNIISNEKMRFKWWRSVAAVLIVALVATVLIFQSNYEGQKGQFSIVDLEENTISLPVNEVETTPLVVSINKENNIEKTTLTVEKFNEPIKQNVVNEVSPLMTVTGSSKKVITAAEFNSENERIVIPVAIQEQVQPIIQEQDFVVEESISEQPSNMIVDEDGNIIPKGMTKEEVAFFKSDGDDEQLKLNVRKDAIKDGKRDQPITAYEIEVKSDGLTDHLMNQGSKEDSLYIGRGKIEGEKTSVIAAISEPKTIAKKPSKEVVIKEYKIEKADILNPPMEDYHSLVRTKYKRKGHPSVGYFHYKHYLKESVACLLENYKNVAYLEEVSIKFRVYKDGKIEFLDLFGVNNEKCVEVVRQSIVSGPTWELKEYYESIDIEVPFKVLYPFFF